MHVTPKKPACSRRGRLLAISRSFEFPFCFFRTLIYLYFFTPMQQKLIGKAFLEIGSRPFFFSEKDRQVIKITPARLQSRARQRLIESDHLSFLPSKQSRLHRRITKRNDYNGKTQIGVERNNAANYHFFYVMGTCFRGNFCVNSLLSLTNSS